MNAAPPGRRRPRAAAVGWAIAAAAAVVSVGVLLASAGLSGHADRPAPPGPSPETTPALTGRASAHPRSAPLPRPAAPTASTTRQAAASTPQALPAWHRLPADEPVDLLILRAEGSPNLDDRASIPHLLAWCFSVPASVPDDSLALRMMAQWANSDGPALAAVVAQATAARHRLRELCDEPALNRLMDTAQVREALVSARMSPVRSLMVGESQRDPERYTQAAQQVLANPQVHPLALDLWLQQQLRHNLPAAVYDDPAQRHHVHARLMDRLAGPAAPDGLWALARCASGFVCPASTVLTPSQQAPADAAADQLEAWIREQRWSQLRLR